MSLTLKRLLGVTAAVTTGAAALFGTGAGTAGAYGGAHCERAEQDIWSDGPSRNLTAHRCSIPSSGQRWYTVHIDTLVQRHYAGDTLDGRIDRSRTRHNATIRCLGHLSGNGSVNWFGCPPV